MVVDIVVIVVVVVFVFVVVFVVVIAPSGRGGHQLGMSTSGPGRCCCFC